MNKIAEYLGKPVEEFTRRDLVKFIQEQNIEMVNFRYVGGDGRLKTLNFVITGRAQLDRLLSTGERVDGSSLLPHINPAASDLYVIPRYKTAFVNPFASIPTVDILCSYYNSQGVRLPSSPENIVKKAHEELQKSTGLSLEAMGELEYYVLYDSQQSYPVLPQKGYHESSPFTKWEQLRLEAMQAVAQAGGNIKYGHTEVGILNSEDFKMEQHELEFMPAPIEDAADQIIIAKWMLRMIAYKYGVTISFAPKILIGHAGSGLHIHSRLVKDGKNMMVAGSQISDMAKKVIAGYLKGAPSLTAFGNIVPTSYLRLVPHQEAPTHVCWGYGNRSTLVRVPLGWLNVNNMAQDANPVDRAEIPEFMVNQTVELRCPDGSANIYLLLAGMAVAARHGLEMADALRVAENLYVDVNIFAPENKPLQEKLPHLPTSCWDSAGILLKERELYEKDGDFPATVIDDLAKQLKSYDDQGLSERLYNKKDEIKKTINEYLHCG